MTSTSKFEFIEFPVIAKKRLHQTVFAYDESSIFNINSSEELMEIIEREKVDGAIYDLFKIEDGDEKPYLPPLPDEATDFSLIRSNGYLEFRFYRAKRNVALHFKSKNKIEITKFKIANNIEEKTDFVLSTKSDLQYARRIVFIDALADRYIMTEAGSSLIFPVKVDKTNNYSFSLVDLFKLVSPKATRKYVMYIEMDNGELIRIMFSKSIGMYITEGSKKEAVLVLSKKETTKIKIAIFGSCYSRRAFTSKDFYNPGYKEKYQVVLTQFQSSICTFGNNIPTTNVEMDTIVGMNPNPQKWAITERKKLFKELLKESGADYLIIDLHGDIQRGYVEYPNGERLTNAYFNYDYMKKHPEYEKITPSKMFDKYFREFKRCVNDFLTDILAVVPEERIIINRTNASLDYYDEDNNLIPFKKRDTEIKTYNMIANTFSDYLISKLPMASVIDTFDYGFHADIKAPGDHSINHFESKFYKKFMKDVDQTILSTQNSSTQSSSTVVHSSNFDDKDENNNFRVIYPSGLALSDGGPVSRKAPRPMKERQKDYVKQYDYKTVFYDVFESNNRVVFSGPPFRNLEAAFHLAKYYLYGNMRTDFPKQINGWKEQKLVFPVNEIESKYALDRSYSVEVGRFSGTGLIAKDMLNFFKDMNVLVAMNKDNRFEWIQDWGKYYSKNHDVTGIVLYNNNSELYSSEELLECLKEIPGIEKGIVVDWHYKWGPIGTRVGNDDSAYAQYVMLEHVRHKFLLKSSGMINCDIDELIVCEDGRSIFDHVSESKSGAIRFDGVWVENIRESEDNVPSFKDFVYNDVTRNPTTFKYAIDPRRIPETTQLWVHRFSKGFKPDTVEGIHHRHFKGLSTNYWKKSNRTEPLKYDANKHVVDQQWVDIAKKTFEEND